ncbi:LacI family DNA-binding transcriptional regulator [Dictyobacter formicarum]|uniref:LacI family transcriptional regulator n=1 Tax=Dictyobacter formicarum TaxID=2778368 RepID=A0ABQ3VGJ6_9CHLR|nr:LacI family DNA-binding transcriptional regulator [Dictyobacter formicarum]GHO84758.1 LacI family transcriptional regulator [Dictyobacter formicarum]
MDQRVAHSVTIKDVAQSAGVSIGTVSRVLNRYENVSEDLKQRVLKAAAELGYSKTNAPHLPSRNGDGKLKEIGFLHTSINPEASLHPFWAHILHGAESEASASGSRVTYRNIQPFCGTPNTLQSKLYEMHLDGILLVGPIEPDIIHTLQTAHIPMVLVDNCLSDQSIDAVLSNNFEGAQQAVTYLIEQGHQRIAFIGGPLVPGQRLRNKVYTIERRAAGYRNALYHAGLPLDDTLLEESNLTPEGGYEACKRLFDRQVSFSAIFCANDPVAMGAMKAIFYAGKRAPEDISIVGYDDLMAEHLTPALTTVRVNKEAMGAAAIRALLARMKDPQAETITITVRTELIKRDSVLPYTREQVNSHFI